MRVQAAYLVTEYTVTGPSRPEASNGEFARYGLTSANVYLTAPGC